MVLRNFRRAAFCGEKNPARRLLQRGMSYNYLASILVEGGREWRERARVEKEENERERLCVCVFSFAAVSGGAFSLTLVLLFRLCLHLITLQYLTLFLFAAQKWRRKREFHRAERAKESEIQKCLSYIFHP
jgi:hypothetical protein